MDITLQEVADIIDTAKGGNYFANQLESSLQPLFNKIKSVKNDKTDINVMSLFDLGDKRSKEFRKRYETLLENILSGFEDKAKTGITGGKAGVTPQTKPANYKYNPQLSKGMNELAERKFKANQPNFKTEISQEEEEVKNVNVVSISDKLLDKLGGARSTISSNDTSSGGSGGGGSSSGGGSGLIGNVLKGLLMGGLAAGLIGGGLSLSLKGLIEGGPTKGLFKLIGNYILGVGSNIIKTYTTGLGGMIKDLTGIIGRSLKTFGSTMFKYLKGYVNMHIKLFSTLVLKPVAWMSKKLIPDIVESLSTNLESLGGIFKGTVSKISSSNIVNILKTSLSKVFKPLAALAKGAGMGAKIAFKSIPFLGPLISLAFAVSRFKDGDMVGGFLELTAGLVGLVPVVGNALSLIPNVVLAFRDFTMTEGEKVSQGGNFMEGIRTWFVNLPFVQSMTNVFTGIGLIFGGKSPEDVEKGLAYLMGDYGLLSFLFPWARPLMSVITYFLGGGFVNHVGVVAGGIMDFGGFLMESIGGLMKTAMQSIATAVTNIFNSDLVQSKIKMITEEWKELVKGIFDSMGVAIGNAFKQVANIFRDDDNQLELTNTNNDTLTKVISERMLMEQRLEEARESVRNAQQKRLEFGDRAERGAMIDKANAAKEKAEKEEGDKKHNELLGAIVGAGNNTVAAIGNSAIKVAEASKSSGGDIINNFLDNESKAKSNSSMIGNTRWDSLDELYGN